MLILTRHAGEDIVIEPGGIKIRIVTVGGNRVRIGIEAPESHTVLRGELVGRYDLMRKWAEEDRKRKDWDKEVADGREEA